MKQHAIVLFDGKCTFCHKSVQFIIKHDPEAYFHFASLEGTAGKRLKEQYHVPNKSDSLVLIDNETYYTASSAALQISRKLHGIYRLASVFLLVPKPIRDKVYESISKRRRHLLQNHACLLPDHEQHKRFLD